MNPHRLRLRTLMIAGACAAGLALVYCSNLPDSPVVKARRLQAESYGVSERDWMKSERLALEGVTKIVSYGPKDHRSELLTFNHYVSRRRPAEAEKARAFDRDSAEVAARCRIMANYYRQRRKSWEWAAAHPS